STTLADVRALTTGNGTTPRVMSGVKRTTIPGIGLVAEDFPLVRTVAKVTVQTADGVGNFTLGSFELRNGNSEGSILAGAENSVSTTPATGTLTPATGEPLYACPGSKESTPFLIIKGAYNGTDSYYRVNLKTTDWLDILPNHHYEVTITQVNGAGYATADEAAKHDPTNLTATIYDHQPTVYNMITNGEAELGVSDTIEIGAQADATAEFSIKYYPGTPTDLKVEVDTKDAYWLELDNDGTPTAPTTLGDGKETGTLYTYRVKVTTGNLTGDSRYGLIHVSAGGLSREVVVKQTEEFLNDTFGSISLTVKEYERDEYWEVTSTKELGPYTNYWDFIRGRDKTNPLYGINSEAMGGKIRTEGFHAPMSDFLQFVYTFTLPDEEDNSEYQNVSWKVELAEEYEDKLLFWNGKSSPVGSGVTIDKASFLTGSSLTGQSFTFTNKLLDLQNNGKIEEDAYRYGKDAFRIVLTNNDTQRTTTLSYDLYHTGVFAYDDGEGTYQTGTTHNDQGWYYYEVILMGNNYWLDRNLGAKSSGYYMQDGDGNSLLGNGGWPLSDSSAGGLYSIADEPVNNEPTIIDDMCPKGFRIPYMSEFNALVADPKFSNEYVVNAGTDYWCSYYLSTHGSVYFPKNRMYYGGQAAGDANAGYYWTRTAALGASGTERGYWLQFMKFSGSNASAGRYRIWQDESSPNGMSVRCVYASRVVETSYDIEFYVKGYTHVFLYNDDGNGNLTYLNSWPGDMIAINSGYSLNMYHPFVYNSVTEYTGLKVVFYIVDDNGNVTESYPSNYETNGGLPFSRTQSDKFFHKGGSNWTSTAE
ncbi:hypothetical protein, partial [uncultured Bacteroides sp.]|uniref:hypothetical protein n=1 Tax=uncultured Bacteroides sp. TaxID=162156 RepID=UPI00260A6D0D